MKGVFELRDHRALMAKLERDFEVITANPRDSDAAYNFFVTGWHLLEWAFPGDEQTQGLLRDENVCLQICRHIALGAKHFELTTLHKAVSRTGKDGGMWAEGAWADGVWADGFWGEKLYIDLLPNAAQALGAERIFAVDLANKVIEFWRKNLP